MAMKKKMFHRILFVPLVFLTLTLLSFPFERNLVGSAVTITVPDDYGTIQSAVDNANSGDTIFVRNGIYIENVVINKTLTLIGENSSSTIIDGGGLGSVVTVAARNVGISGFTIQNTSVGYPNSGIRLVNSSWYCILQDNILTADYVGILLDSSLGSLLEGNQVVNAHYGIYLLNSPGNRILDNNVSSDYAGLVMFSSDRCQIIENYVSNNTVGVSVSACSANVFYHNNFVKNSYQVTFTSDIYSNTWDNDYPSGGNYWSGYSGRDLYMGRYQNITGSDGIGDYPNQLTVNNVDRFPFMNPISIFHDVAVLSVVPSASRVYQGQTINVSVVVANFGNFSETFTVSVYNVNGSNETLVSTEPVTALGGNAQATVTFEWNTLASTPGSYTIKAQANSVAGEKNLANNVLYSGTVAIIEPSHDVAVLSVVPSASRVYQGQTVNISVVVSNVGSYVESFNVTAYYDDFVIGQQSVATLGVGNEFNLIYSWNTTGVEPDRDYPIRAEATGVVGEVNLENNVLFGGSVRVRSLALGAIGISQLVPSDQMGNPVSSFGKGGIGYFKVAVNNTSFDSEVVLVTVNIYDSSSSTLGVVSFRGSIMPGVYTYVLGLPIPSTAYAGTAIVYADTFTDWPSAGGLAYGPEKSATFQISG
jgi:parallel beta-helix repeat protein